MKAKALPSFVRQEVEFDLAPLRNPWEVMEMDVSVWREVVDSQTRLRQRTRTRTTYQRKVDKDILFSAGWHGALWKYGYTCIARHCARYGKDMHWECMRDAIQDAIVEFCASDHLNDLDNLLGCADHARAFARAVINAYRRETRAIGLYRQESLIPAIAPEESERSRLPSGHFACHDTDLARVEREEAWKQTLTPVQYTVAKMAISGYSQAEMAKALRKGLRTIQREFASVRRALADKRLFPPE